MPVQLAGILLRAQVQLAPDHWFTKGVKGAAMLVYEEARTENLVKRMVALARPVRTMMLLFWVIGLASIAGAGAYLVEPASDAWPVYAITGGLIGYVIACVISKVVVAGLEWMAQSLVAQENILKALSKAK